MGRFSRRTGVLSFFHGVIMNRKSSIGQIKGIGSKTIKLYEKLGVYFVEDLIRYYPRGFEIYTDPVPVSEAEEGSICTVCGTVTGRIHVSPQSRSQITTLYLKDKSGTLKVIWFRMPFLRTTLGKGGPLILRGRIVRKRDGLVMEHPDIFYPAAKYEEKLHTMQPLYSLTAGLTNNAVIKAVHQALEYVSEDMDVLPQYLAQQMKFPPFKEAIYAMHFPKTKEQFILARKRFVFEEFLEFILCLRQTKQRESRTENTFHLPDRPELSSFLNSLPYELTNAQKTVWNEIRKDMQGKFVMSRLVQGDVGSGKTILAFLALLLVGLNGCQGALMAPTEVLARQHFATISNMLATYGFPLQAELLTGSMTAAQKKAARSKIESGESSIIIGTHALIQENVLYSKLALVVTDEQHRFGVRQREAFAAKGQTPHILVMSATPIPRTLAIILYGDLDISVINELPKNRLPIKNCVVDTGYREKAYAFIRKQVCQGRQCYIICPMVEESESIDVENVTDYERMLSEELGSDIKTACLHGKMKQQEKDLVMESFSRNEIQVLVSTTVIEVGIDVPNATVIMIENAERFGLAQLHQLRGRVGRGQYQSYCIFMTPSKSKETRERLEILNHSNDGFFIAGEDLRLRGPGDLFGIRQSGLLDFRIGDVFQDSEILKQASESAAFILEKDPLLDLPLHSRLKKRIESRMKEIVLEHTL